MAARASAVIERLIEDDYFQEQLTTGADRLAAAYRRGRSMRAAEAAQDQKLIDQLRGAAAALVAAGKRLIGTPEPEPARRRRTVPALAVGIGVLALVRSMHRAQQRDASGA
jgi:hypothetical protein